MCPPPWPCRLQLQRALHQACNLAHASQLAAALPIEPPPAAPYNPDGMTIQSTRSDNLYDQPAVYGRCSRATQQASALATRQLSGSAHALVAASWAMHGAAALAHTHALVQVMGHQCSGRDEDLALAWAQLMEVTAAKRGGPWSCGGGQADSGVCCCGRVWSTHCVQPTLVHCVLVGMSMFGEKV
jgi:hypothetical protein